ncbi:MAG: aminodeoxychorismate synthase component I [Candidatus Tantalella remota]|nr:aminodeoxychorismate synthase component I [Candidatus Tantalella remota]
MKNIFLPIKNKVDIHREKCGLSPEEVFSRFADGKNVSFLNSSMESDVARFSILGIHPFLTLKNKNGIVEATSYGQTSFEEMDPFDCLSLALNKYHIENSTDLPFIAGGIGYFSYDLKNSLEDLPSGAEDDLFLPDMYFAFYQALIIFDRFAPGYVQICSLEIESPLSPDTETLLSDILEKLRVTEPVTVPRFAGKQDPVFGSNFSKNDYLVAIKKVKEHISAGDIYQVCLSQRFKSESPLSPHELYLRLNNINPSPFSAYIEFNHTAIISSSPELFIRRTGDRIETRPMKGTRPRGRTPGDDNTIREELKASAKDISELLMIVDLERNDLGRIAIPGSVMVSEHRRIEAYPTVFQTSAVIHANVPSGTNNVDIIKAVFPCGSITGCPKIRAMQIIDEIEPTARGIYTGAIGYISFHGTMDLNVTIRTMVKKGKDLYFQAGGGIVAESDPEAEYEETLVKAKALMDSLR